MGQRNDLSGTTYGFLSVDGLAYIQNGKPYWSCTCRCGNHVVKSSSFLYKSINKMCDGCNKKYRDINNVMAKDNLDERGCPIMVYQFAVNKIKNTYEIRDEIGIINDKILIDEEQIPLFQKINRSITINDNGYAVLKYGNHHVLLSRLILKLPFGNQDNDLEIAEHINGNRLDNRRENLRICVKHLNPVNCKKYSNNKSGCKGVSWLNRLQKWQVNIQYDKILHYLGVYENYQDAVLVRKEAEEKYFGEFNRAEDYLENGISRRGKISAELS